MRDEMVIWMERGIRYYVQGTTPISNIKDYKRKERTTGRCRHKEKPRTSFIIGTGTSVVLRRPLFPFDLVMQRRRTMAIHTRRGTMILEHTLPCVGLGRKLRWWLRPYQELRELR